MALARAHGLLSLAMMISIAAPAAAQSPFTGSWQVDATPVWTAVLRVNGTRVAGKVSQCSSQVSADILDGAVDGNSLTFRCQSPDGDRLLTLRGTLREDEIRFTWSMEIKSGGVPADVNVRGREGILGPSSPAEFVARRVPDDALAEEFDRPRGLEFAGGVNVVDGDVKAEGALFLPAGVSRVRGVLVVIAWGTGFNAYAQPEWRRFVETLNFGLLRASIRHISEPNASLIGPGRVPPDAGARALALLLQRLAADSGRQEVAAAPLVLWGHSAAGGHVARLASLLPQRTIAFVRYHSGAATPDFKIVGRIPALLMIGARDAGNSVGAESMWRSARASGAPWTFAIEPAATHGDANDVRKANRLLFPWIAAVVEQRLSAGSAALAAVSESSGWLGELRSGLTSSYASFAGDKREAAWLPDEQSSRAWREVLLEKVDPGFAAVPRNPASPELGAWRGVAFAGGQTYDVEILLERLVANEAAGGIRYPRLDCSGRLVLQQKTSDGAYVMGQTILSGTGCGSERIIMRLLSDDRVLCEWRPSADSLATAMALLERKRLR